MNARKNGKHTPKNYGNITRKLYPNSMNEKMKKFNKEEDILLEKLNKCKTEKCAELNKERMKEQETFEKEQDKSCPQKSSNAFYECSTRFYEKSKYKRLFDKFVECVKNKCAKERKTLKNLRREAGL